MGDAKVSIMTHAFMYGTATFEGIRAYWNEEHGRLYGLKLREHVERLRQSCRILLMENVPSVDELTGLIVETVRRNGFREDAYIRPSFYKSTRAIGVRLHDLENELYIIALPFGNYIDTESGVRLMTSSWRRNADEALPARGKIVGGYVNMAFQKTEAELNGFDEALVLTAGGHVNEASAANLFVVRDGVAHHPAGQRRPARGRDPQGDHRDPRQRGHPDRDPLDRPLRAVRRRRGAPVRDRRPGARRSSRSTIARSGPARSGRSADWSASATSMRSAAGCPSTATGSRRSNRGSPPRDGAAGRADDRRRQDSGATLSFGVFWPIVRMMSARTAGSTAVSTVTLNAFSRYAIVSPRSASAPL